MTVNLSLTITTEQAEAFYKMCMFNLNYSNSVNGVDLNPVFSQLAEGFKKSIEEGKPHD